MFFFKSYVASYGYVRRPGTDRIPEGVPKKFLRNRNRDSCEKSATGEENTGILRIPAGITNLGLKPYSSFPGDSHHLMTHPRCSLLCSTFSFCWLVLAGTTMTRKLSPSSPLMMTATRKTPMTRTWTMTAMPCPLHDPYPSLK